MNRISFFITIVLLLTAEICRCESSVSVLDILENPEVFILTSQDTIPVLIGKERNPILRINVNVSRIKRHLTLTSIVVNIIGTTSIQDIASVSIYFTDRDSRFTNPVPFAKNILPAPGMIFNGNQSQKEGDNFFWVSCKLHDGADLTHVVDAGCDYAMLDGTKKIEPFQDTTHFKNRIGIALRQHGDDGVDTYRIPGLATSNKGTLIAVYDIRHNGPSDLQADIDIGMSRSTDGGQTWEPMKVIMDMGEWGGLPQDQNGIGDPSILVDRGTGPMRLSWLATCTIPKWKP